MRKKELTELKSKEKKEMMKLVTEKKTELTNISGRMYAGKEKNLKKGKMLRRDIAQIITVMSQMPNEIKKEVKKEKKEKKVTK